MRAAVALQKQKADLSLETFSELRLALQHKAVQLLEPPRSEPNEEAVRKRLNKQRDHLFTFLDHDGVDATNNLATYSTPAFQDEQRRRQGGGKSALNTYINYLRGNRHICAVWTEMI